MASRREEKERRRQERIARERAEAESARRRRVYSVVAGSVLSVAAVAAIVFALAAGGGGGAGSAGGTSKAKNTLPPPAQKTASLAVAAKKAHCVLRSPVIEGRTHVTKPVKYKTNPPTSGNHYPIPQPDGVYAKPPALTHIVHTLEHGRIEVQYTPSLSPKRIRQLGGLFNEDPSYMLLFPNETMPYEIAVTAWGQLAGCKKATDATFDVIRAFRQRYLGKSPEPLSTQPTNF